MKRSFMAVALLAALVIGAAPAAGVAKTNTKHSIFGPTGLRFYSPGKLPKGPHGTLIWERSMTGGESLKGAKNYLVDYKQIGVRGTMVPVSGMVAVPKGKAPKGGWPVITWAHGTTGIADVCAPSRLPAGTGGLNIPMLESWIKAGYAVVRTDYEGLGGPGPHPYLIGISEGRGMLDIVRAARQLDPQLSDRVVISGHSQGGHAALWAASLVKKYTPEITLRGVLAFAPASHIATEAGFLKSLKTTSLTGLAATIFRGLDVAYPSLHISSLLTSQAVALYPQTLTKCLGQLDQPDSFGGLPLDQLVKQTADISAAVGDLQKNDPSELRIGAPVLLEQGSSDTTVLPPFTAALAKSLAGVGDTVTEHTYTGATHGTVLTAAQADQAAFLKKRFVR
jgi:pimeloyl-ACP methyl ester carboxylesterase